MSRNAMSRKMSRKQQRLMFLGVGAVLLGLAALLVAYAIGDGATFFYTPSQMVEKKVQAGTRIRLGGLVKKGSVVKSNDAVNSFIVTDMVREQPVTYRGQVPDLFAEGQGVIAEGALGPGGVFVADNVLAKHDENYMPKEVSDALKKSGVWQEDAKP